MNATKKQCLHCTAVLADSDPDLCQACDLHMQQQTADPFSLNPEATTQVVRTAQPQRYNQGPKATDKQLAFIRDLAVQANATDKVEARLAQGITKGAASNLIDELKIDAAAQRKAQRSQPQDDTQLEGMHKVDGVIYKVQRAVHGSNNLYAKRLEVHGHGDASFEYAPGAIRRLSAATKLSLEEAKAFGALYGTCCVCGRTLTNESSIAAGIGPVCAGKF